MGFLNRIVPVLFILTTSLYAERQCTLSYSKDCKLKLENDELLLSCKSDDPDYWKLIKSFKVSDLFGDFYISKSIKLKVHDGLGFSLKCDWI